MRCGNVVAIWARSNRFRRAAEETARRLTLAKSRDQNDRDDHFVSAQPLSLAAGNALSPRTGITIDVSPPTLTLLGGETKAITATIHVDRNALGPSNRVESAGAAVEVNDMGLVTTIPWMFMAGMAGVHEREYYKVPQ